MRNPSGIRPVEFKVLVRPVEVQKISPGGVHLPESTVEMEEHAQMQGEIVEISPLAFDYGDYPDGMCPKVGDMVMFAKFAGAKWKGKDGGDYRVLNDKDIVAVLS